MTDLLPEQRAEIDRLREANPDRGSRWIAAQLGGSVSYSTILRHFAEQRVDGDMAENALNDSAMAAVGTDEPSAAVVAEAVVHQVAEAAAADRGSAETTGVTAPTVPAQDRPWESYRPFDAAQERAEDIMTLLAKIAEGGVGRNGLRAAVDLPEERFRNAFSVVQIYHSAVDDPQTGTLMLTTTGRSLLESSRPRPAPPPVTVDLETAFDRYRAAGDEAWPAWRDEQQRVLHEAEVERNWQAMQLRGSVAGYFHTLPTFDQEWEWITEPDLKAANVLAVRPRFRLPGGADVYLRLDVTRGYDGVMVRASTGGNAVWLPAHSGPREIEQKLGLALKFGLAEVAKQRGGVS